MKRKSEEGVSLRELIGRFQNLDSYLRSNIMDASDSMTTRASSRSTLEDFLIGYRDIADVFILMNYFFEAGTILQMAAQYGRDDLIGIFVQHGADINQFDVEGETALHVAIYHGQIDVVNALLAHGADPNFRPDGGFTAIEVAMYLESWDILNLLAPNQTRLEDEEAIVSCSVALYRTPDGRVVNLEEEIVRLQVEMDEAGNTSSILANHNDIMGVSSSVSAAGSEHIN